jgi:predicted dehydrogenase
MGKLRLAFLGVGDVAQRDYLPELHRIADQVELVAVCGRGEERARAVAEQYGAPAWYTDYERMLADGDIEAVINLTPIQLHTETNIAALQAGKHLYTEKPIAPTLQEAARVQEEARERNLVLVSAPCVMLFPQVQVAQRLLQEGAIGRVCSARAHGHGGVPPWSGYTSDPSQFFVEGGGPLRDMGVYPLHALTGLLGPARQVNAMAARAQRSFVVQDGPAAGKTVPIEVEDNWHLVLDLGEERLASVAANNCVQETQAPQLELYGLQGTIAVNLLDVSAPVELLRAGNGWEEIEVPQEGRASGPDHLLGIQHLAECIRERREPLLSAAHAVHVVEIIEKAARSAAEGRTLRIESSF